MTIVMTLALLVALIVLKQRCGVAMSSLFRVIDTPTDGGTRD